MGQGSYMPRRSKTRKKNGFFPLLSAKHNLHLQQDSIEAAFMPPHQRRDSQHKQTFPRLQDTKSIETNVPSANARAANARGRGKYRQEANHDQLDID